MSSSAPGPGRGRPAGRSGDESRGVALAAARRVFARDGYAGASTRELAAAAGMEPANLRHHFGSKAELYARVVDDAMGELGDVLAHELALTPAGAGPAPFLRRLGALAAEAPDLVTLVALAPLDRARHPELAGPLGDGAVGLEALVRAAVAEWRPDAPPELADALIAIGFGLAVYPARIDRTLDAAAVIEAVATLFDR